MISILLASTHPSGRRLRIFAALGVTAILAICIAILTLLPLSTPPGPPGADKLYHVIAFAALTMPCALFYPRFLIWLLPAAILFGGGIEFIQPSVGREGEWTDFYADAWGVAVGAAAGFTLRIILKEWLRRYTLAGRERMAQQ